jgi:hypothetical protein
VNPQLELLRDIALPEPIGWAPQTVGWWILLALIVAAGVAAAILIRRRRRAGLYRRMALAELERIEAAMTDPGAGRSAAAELPALVKRTALAVFPRGEVASLSGDSWLRFLDESYGGKGFSAGPGKLLPSLAYAPTDSPAAPSGDSLRELTELLRDWIRSHRVRI